MELATALIWTLRIVLPIILFCVYFKLQAPKDEQHCTGPTNCSYSRNKILAQRSIVVSNPGLSNPPPRLEDLQLKDQTQAPGLFVTPKRERPRREPRDFDKSRRERKSEGKGKEGQEAEDKPVEGPPSFSEEKMNIESLLNYVAFNRREQQRVFLMSEETAPPPPRPPGARAPAVAATAGAAAAAKTVVSGAEAEKANVEAQMVLKGAIKFKRSDVANDLYEQLHEQRVEIAERTFTLMIEASVLANDLKSSSDFLIKMEASDFCPDSNLLDKVMDLYSKEKSQRELAKQQRRSSQGSQSGAAGAVRGAMAAEDSVGGVRSKLASDAAIFVPSFGIPPPPPRPSSGKIAIGAAGAADNGDPAAGEVAAQLSDKPSTEVQRTKLTAAAKPFEPQFNVTFDPSLFTWTVHPPEEQAGDVGKTHGQGAENGHTRKNKTNRNWENWGSQNEEWHEDWQQSWLSQGQDESWQEHWEGEGGWSQWDEDEANDTTGPKTRKAWLPKEKEVED